MRPLTRRHFLRAVTAAPVLSLVPTGHGDVNALVEQAAASNPKTPRAVYMMFNRSPSVVAVPAGSPIRTPTDFAGKHFRGHATDVALQTFPALAAKVGLDAATVRISSNEDGMGAVVQSMLKGETDGTFGYETTITAALITAKIPTDRVRFFFYRDLVPELYGSALMASMRLIAALAALRRRVPAMVEPAEQARLDLTLAGEMGHAEGARLGIGAIDSQRFAAGMHLLCETKRLARVPAVADVFNGDSPVPATERITRLAAPHR